MADTQPGPCTDPTCPVANCADTSYLGQEVPESDVVEQLRNFGGEVVRTVVAAGFVTKDSGQREEFTTGSRRDSREGKGRYDLLPPEGIRRLAQLYERGAAKYGDRNWEKGQPVSRYLDSLLRHVFCYLEGEATEDHLAAAAWNALGAIVTEERTATGLLPAELNDLRGEPTSVPDVTRRCVSGCIVIPARHAGIICVVE